MTKGVGQSSHECIQHWRQKVRIVKWRAAGGVPNLLLVVQPFREFASDIKPGRSGFRPSPTYRAAHRHQVERREARLDFRSREGQKIHQQARAHATPPRTHSAFSRFTSSMSWPYSWTLSE